MRNTGGEHVTLSREILLGVEWTNKLKFAYTNSFDLIFNFSYFFNFPPNHFDVKKFTPKLK